MRFNIFLFICGCSICLNIAFLLHIEPCYRMQHCPRQTNVSPDTQAMESE